MFDYVLPGTDEDECDRCSDFDALGRGFIEADDNPRMCGHYKECYKVKNSGVITSVDRWCAPGTYTDPEDIRRGAPCTKTTCDPTECDDCGFPTVSTPEHGEFDEIEKWPPKLTYFESGMLSKTQK